MEQPLIELPTIELGGKKYTVKLDAETLRGLNQAGVTINAKMHGNKVTFDFSNMVDICHFVCSFKGTHLELAELLHDKRNDFMHCLFMASWAWMMSQNAKSLAATNLDKASPVTVRLM